MIRWTMFSSTSSVHRGGVRSCATLEQIVVFLVKKGNVLWWWTADMFLLPHHQTSYTQAFSFPFRRTSAYPLRIADIVSLLWYHLEGQTITKHFVFQRKGGSGGDHTEGWPPFWLPLHHLLAYRANFFGTFHKPARWVLLVLSRSNPSQQPRVSKSSSSRMIINIIMLDRQKGAVNSWHT